MTYRYSKQYAPPPPAQANAFNNMHIPLPEAQPSFSKAYAFLRIFAYIVICIGVSTFFFGIFFALMPSLLIEQLGALGRFLNGAGLLASLIIFVTYTFISMGIVAQGLILVAYVELVNNSRAQKAYLEYLASKA